MTKRQQKALITSVCLLILGLLGYSTTPKSKPAVSVPAGQYLVTHVTDGDTFDVQASNGAKETVRMIGMDTPETHDPRKAVQCFGEVAAAKSKELLDGKTVRLEADPTDSDRDKYHRLLRFVYLADGTFVNQYLTQQGYAFAYTVFPNLHLEEFRAWEKEARENNRGLWAGCKVDESSQIKQTNNAQ